MMELLFTLALDNKERLSCKVCNSASSACICDGAGNQPRVDGGVVVTLSHLGQFMDYLQKTNYRGYLANVLGDHYQRGRQQNYIY